MADQKSVPAAVFEIFVGRRIDVERILRKG
jgi:hypothetical protein